MEIAKTQFLALAMLVIVGTSSSILRASAQGCGASIPELAFSCLPYVQVSGPKVPPSLICCLVVKTLDVPCLCSQVTPDIEKIISMEKVVFVGRSCGVTVQPGFKCGSYTVPPKSPLQA